MRQITIEVTNAFEQRRVFKKGNSRTDGTAMYLFNNKIAEWRSDGLWITNAGWSSSTTKERLNGLMGVHVQQRAGNWYLNGRYWDGSWTNVDEFNDARHIVTGIDTRGRAVGSAMFVEEPQPEEVEFDTTSEWNGKCSVPTYSVYHTHVEAEIPQIEVVLALMGIPTRRMFSDTEGEYKPNHFIVVPVENFDTAKAFTSKVSVETI